MSRGRSDQVYLEDILAAAESAKSFIAGMTYEEFAQDQKTVFAVIRALEIVGEATKQISDDFKLQHPALPWRIMAGMRDKLIHGYFGVNLSIVWSAVTQNLPEIEPHLRLLLDDSQD